MPRLDLTATKQSPPESPREEGLMDLLEQLVLAIEQLATVLRLLSGCVALIGIVAMLMVTQAASASTAGLLGLTSAPPPAAARLPEA